MYAKVSETRPINLIYNARYRQGIPPNPLKYSLAFERLCPAMATYADW